MLSADKIVASFVAHGITHVVGVPDNGSRALYEKLWAHDDIEVILTSREGEAYGLASGLYLGGARPLVLIQNTGFFEAGDAFLFENRVYHTAAPNLSDRTAKVIIFGYSYWWMGGREANMRQVRPGLEVLQQVDTIRQQLLGGEANGLVEWAEAQGMAAEPLAWTMEV